MRQAGELETGRFSRADRLIKAGRNVVYGALLAPTMLEGWLAPTGRSGEIHGFDPREGGGYSMTLNARAGEPPLPGETTGNEDRVHVIFCLLRPGSQIRQRVIIATRDPGLARELKVTWTLEGDSYVTLVSVLCEEVSPDTSPVDRQVGLDSWLENLARFVALPG